ncbi:hypothetical protein ACFXB4_16070 [Streptomyces lavendulae]|uniref:hypothetical protein n=1 Tax=Streptomyces lavendulae TaxID=1914 RepID=UPI003687A594
MGVVRAHAATTWVWTKLRWDLAVDENERQALLRLAEDCPTTTVLYDPPRSHSLMKREGPGGALERVCNVDRSLLRLWCDVMS